MRKAITVLCMLAAACGGGDWEDDIKIERTPSDIPGVWIKVCNPGSWFCTLTVGSCDSSDTTCKVCDPNQPLGQC